MTDQLNDIKSYLLTKYTTFDTGFANVSKPNQTELIIDADGQSYCGIADNLGNYFYIRSLKSATYTPHQRSARIAYYDAVTQCRIVVIHHNANEENVLQLLINSVTAKGHRVTKSDCEATRVFTEETGAKLNTNEFTLVSVDFEVTEIISSKNCTLNPCDC